MSKREEILEKALVNSIIEITELKNKLLTSEESRRFWYKEFDKEKELRELLENKALEIESTK